MYSRRPCGLKTHAQGVKSQGRKSAVTFRLASVVRLSYCMRTALASYHSHDWLLPSCLDTPLKNNTTHDFLSTVMVQDDAITKAVGECHAIVMGYHERNAFLVSLFLQVVGLSSWPCHGNFACCLWKRHHFKANKPLLKGLSWGVIVSHSLCFPALSHSAVLTAFSEVVVRQCAGPLSRSLSLSVIYCKAAWAVMWRP